MDNYLFNFCKKLETVWCKDQVDRIGIQTFGVTPMERLCVNAKNIDINAFSGNEAMKEIHIRSGVERLALSAFAMLPAIETICLEGIDPNVMETNWVNLQNSELTILVPEDTTDEQMEAIGKKFLSSLIITDLSQVKRGTCSMPDDPMPDITEITQCLRNVRQRNGRHLATISFVSLIFFCRVRFQGNNGLCFHTSVDRLLL